MISNYAIQTYLIQLRICSYKTFSRHGEKPKSEGVEIMKRISFSEVTEEKVSVSYKLHKDVKDTLDKLSNDCKLSHTKIVESAILLLANPSKLNWQEWQKIYYTAYPKTIKASNAHEKTNPAESQLKEIPEETTHQVLTLEDCKTHKDLIIFAKLNNHTRQWAYSQAKEKKFSIFGTPDEQDAFYDSI